MQKATGASRGLAAFPALAWKKGLGSDPAAGAGGTSWRLLKTSTKALGALDPVAVLSLLVGLLQHCGYEHTPLSAISKVRS